MDSLSETVGYGIEVLADEKISFEDFKKLLDISSSILVHKVSPGDLLSSIKSADPVIVKQGHAALTTLFLEASKLNADPTVLIGVLEEHKLVQGRQEYTITKYLEVKPQLRKMLAQTLFHPPKVIDIDWRLDYFLKANSVEKINIPIYRIILQTTNKDGIATPVEFACTLEQLQDLVSKLKDAAKQIDRSSGRS